MENLQILLALSPDRIAQEMLRTQLNLWQTQYHKEKKTASKEGITAEAFDHLFVEETSKSMQLMRKLIEKQQPEIFAAKKNSNTPAAPCKETAPKTVVKKKTRSKKATTAKKKDKKTTPKTPEQTQEIEAVIKECRMRIREYQQTKRAAQEQAGTAPKKATRYDKIRGHLIALGNLLPAPLQKDLDTQMNIKRLLLRTQKKLIDLYQMSPRNAEKQVQHIKDKYDTIAEKLQSKTT